MMTNEQKARKFAENFCRAAGESYGDVMDGYDPETGGDDLMEVWRRKRLVINACDVDSLEGDVESLLDEYQPLLEYILHYGSKGALPNTVFAHSVSGESYDVYEMAKKIDAGKES